MSWLSTIFGLILVTSFAIWGLQTRWDHLAEDTAKRMNFTEELRILEARQVVSRVDTVLHDYYLNNMVESDKRVGLRILKNAFEKVVLCVEEFYKGQPVGTFQDCPTYPE